MRRVLPLVLLLTLAQLAVGAWTIRKDGRGMAGVIDAGGRLVGFGGASGLWTSDNATDWVPRFVTGNPQIVDMAWSGKLLVGVTASGDLVTSADGTDWQLRQGALVGGTSWNRIVWLNDSFTVFEGLKQVARLAPDFGVKYTPIGFGGSLRQIHTDGKQLTLFWHSPKQDSVATSADGVSWTKILPSRTWIGGWLDKDEQGWVSVNEDTLLRSDDLLTWKMSLMVDTAGKPERFERVFRVGGKYYGTSGVPWIQESKDGVVWKRSWTPVKGTVLALGTVLRTPTGNHLLATSEVLLGIPDSTRGWRMERETMMNYFEGVGWKNGKIKVTGNRDALLESTDGKNWTVLDGLHSPTPIGYPCLADFGDSLVPIGPYQPRFLTASDSDLGIQGFPRFGWHGNGRRIVVGDEGFLITSDDGKIWQDRKYGTVNLRSGAWYNGLHVVVGDTIITSPDGVVWTGRRPGFRATFNSVAWGGLWVAAGPGSIQISTDGIQWAGIQRSDFPLVNFPSVNTVRYGGGRFVAVGPRGVVLSSKDGYKWDSTNVGVDVVLDDVAWTGAGWVAVGQLGMIFTEGDPVVPPPVSTTPRRENANAAARWNGRYLFVPPGTGTVDLIDPSGRILSFRANADGLVDLRALPSGFWIARGTCAHAWTLRFVR